MGSVEPTSSVLLLDINEDPIVFYSKGKEDVDGSSSLKNKLPYWLQEAIGISSKPRGPDLPPIVSAIARSAQLLYGEEKFTIPSFVVPGPPPSQPKDPRRSLKQKKKKKNQRTHMLSHNFQGGLDSMASSNFHESNVLFTKSKQSSPFGAWGPLTSHKLDQTESHDSNETVSDPTQHEQLDVVEISSEGTVSDHHVSDHEQ
ncbi:Protein CHROMATIN REMODELING 4 [Camellia lanceoleosa]|uniref:Protein CHROMATIN REMODELING 4 n=1 Tax=Camellia lanceoleosa TaxID=1840588 RepID=A0ACC0GF41_9ERIC|nr:Protein CHROMATIN REMODELING 4 [Camellia lanceoleosa]